MLDVEEKKRLIVFFSLFLLAVLIVVGYVESRKKHFFYEEVKPAVPPSSRRCVDCHLRKGIALADIALWESSLHARVAVGCAECHVPVKGAPEEVVKAPSRCEVKEAKRIVSGANCKLCHAGEGKDFEQGLHSGDHHRSWEAVVVSLGAEKAGASPCADCHRVSRWQGQCGVCHRPHAFRASEARRSTACTSCHSGRMHPQIETYRASAHHGLFESRQEDWTAFRLVDVYERPRAPGAPGAPACAYCHHKRLSPYGFMFAGLRSKAADRLRTLLKENLSGNLYSFIAVTWVEDAEYNKRKKSLSERCSLCHAPFFVKERLERMEKDIDTAMNDFLKTVPPRVVGVPDLLVYQQAQIKDAAVYLVRIFATAHVGEGKAWGWSSGP